MHVTERSISIGRSRELLCARINRLPLESVPLDAALGRVLGEPVRCDRDLPPFDRVTMDGIAIRYQEAVRSWHSLGVQFAGDRPREIHAPDQCVQVMTGTRLPHGADTVIPVEWLGGAERNPELASAFAVEPGQCVHLRGSDCCAGDCLIPAGTVLGGAALSLCASVGMTQLQLTRLPRVAFVSTGDELVDVGQTPAHDSIRRSNDRLVAGECAKLGIALHRNLHLPDDPERIREALQTLQTEVDLIVVSGGVSMGKADYIPTCVKQCGFEICFHKIRQKPGGPLLFAQHPSGTLLLGLPGNPLSSLVCARLYLRLVLERLTGFPLASTRVRLAGSPLEDAEKSRLLPVRIEPEESGGIVAVPVFPNTSGDMVRILGTNGIVILPSASEGPSESQLTVEYLDWTT